MEASKKKMKFPSAFSILFIILLIAIGLTWLIPSGSYSKLSYDSTENHFIVKTHGIPDQSYPATEQTLNQLNIKIQLSHFTNGIIKKPIAIPDTYQRIEQHEKGITDMIHAMVDGTIEVADIMIFIFILGGMIGVINKTGAFNAGLMSLTKKTKGNEFSVVFAVCVLMLLGGTACGIEEEAVAFYPILVPVFLALGYDSIVCVGAIFLAASMGTAFSTINPFSVVIASNAAGIPFTEGMGFRTLGLILGGTCVIAYMYWYCKKLRANPEFSYTYDDRQAFYDLYMKDIDPNATVESSFLAITIIIMFISGLPEKDVVNGFTHGASELVGVALIIGLARAVNIILEQGMISDTILDYMTHLVDGMNGGVFIIGQLLIFIFLGLVVPSSSGLAVLAMPIMAPLADTVGIPRDIVVSAYNWGQYIMLFLAPTGLVLVTLQMLGIPFNKWLKFVMPIVGCQFVISSILLLAQVFMYAQ